MFYDTKGNTCSLGRLYGSTQFQVTHLHVSIRRSISLQAKRQSAGKDKAGWNSLRLLRHRNLKAIGGQNGHGRSIELYLSVFSSVYYAHI